MAAERYVVLGVAQVRSPWFREVARWATSAMLPVEFVKAMSLEEVRVRLRSGRGYSALLVDDSLAGLDRDLVELAREAGCAVIVVEGGRAHRAWAELGRLGGAARRRSAATSSCRRSSRWPRRSRAAPRPPPRTADAPAADGYRGRLVAVTGAGGTGPLHGGRRHRPGAGRRSPQPRPRVPGRPGPARRAGDAPRRRRRRARRGRAGRGASRRDARRSTRCDGSPGSSPTAATTCCSASGATATGRPSVPAPSRPASTGCGARSGSWWPTSTPTSRASAPPGRSTSRSATRWPARRRSPPTSSSWSGCRG